MRKLSPECLSATHIFLLEHYFRSTLTTPITLIEYFGDPYNSQPRLSSRGTWGSLISPRGHLHLYVTISCMYSAAFSDHITATTSSRAHRPTFGNSQWWIVWSARPNWFLEMASFGFERMDQGPQQVRCHPGRSNSRLRYRQTSSQCSHTTHKEDSLWNSSLRANATWEHY